jgi:hypothetical protein
MTAISRQDIFSGKNLGCFAHRPNERFARSLILGIGFGVPAVTAHVPAPEAQVVGAIPAMLGVPGFNNP